MSNKLIDLPGLQEFKTQSDLKYQDKLTAGSNIGIVNNVISANPYGATYVAVKDSGSQSISANTIYSFGSVVLQPGSYIIVYTCAFTGTAGYAQCGFSTNTTDITGLGRGFGDSRKKIASDITQTCVSGIINILASEYPNGRTFYMLARHNASGTVTCYPRCYYVKLPN